MFWWRLPLTSGALPRRVTLLTVIRLLVRLPFCVWHLPTWHLLLSRPRTVVGLGCELGVILAVGGTLLAQSELRIAYQIYSVRNIQLNNLVWVRNLDTPANFLPSSPRSILYI